MGSQVSLPLWVVVLMAILAILAALDRILIPSVRWALRRRANRAIEELNTKLKLRIQPFKLTKRQVLTYVAATSSALSYAVGEWAKIWGLSNLIRSMGAYFIARDSGEALYRKVLSRYVHMATAAGVTQAIFPEGGLSRDGKLRPPKFGLLSYMVAGFDPLGPRDVVFIPVALNYDRVLEDRMLTSVASAESGSEPVFGL